MQQMQRGFLKKALRPIAHQGVLVQQMQQMQRGFLKKALSTMPHKRRVKSTWFR